MYDRGTSALARLELLAVRKDSPAGPEDHRVNHQPKLVHKIVLEQGVDELPAPADQDHAGDPPLEASFIFLPKGLAIAGVSPYRLAPAPQGGMIFGYSDLSTSAIRRGVRLLEQAVEDASP